MILEYSRGVLLDGLDSQSLTLRGSQVNSATAKVTDGTVDIEHDGFPLNGSGIATVGQSYKSKSVVIATGYLLQMRKVDGCLWITIRRLSLRYCMIVLGILILREE
jgi:hypothetical protein